MTPETRKEIEAWLQISDSRATLLMAHQRRRILAIIDEQEREMRIEVTLGDKHYNTANQLLEGLIAAQAELVNARQSALEEAWRPIETPRTDGGRTLAITDELVDDPCERCGAESVPNVCEGDGKMHHHGRVHTRDGALQALCASCGTIAAGEWKQQKAA